MFGIGTQELLLIFVIALVVIGPKKLPEIARALGKGYAEFRRAFDDMKRNVESELKTEEIRHSLLEVATPFPSPAPSAPPADSSAGAAPSSPSPYPGDTEPPGPPTPEGSGAASTPRPDTAAGPKDGSVRT